MRGCDPRSNAATFDRAGVFKLAMFNQGSLLVHSPKIMGYALTLAVYDFTPIHSRLWQSVAMAVGYPACGTANTCLFTSPL